MYNETFVLGVCSAAHMISERILQIPLIFKDRIFGGSSTKLGKLS